MSLNSRLLALVLVATMAAGAQGALAAVDAGAPIQPGDAAYTSSGRCTLNFVYDGTGDFAGKVYFGTAAHCVTALKETVRTKGATGRIPIGEVAHIGPYHTSGHQVHDYAFIEVDADVVPRVKADVRGHPGAPSGITAAPEIGDLVHFSGHGVGMSFTATTRENRTGVLTHENGAVWRSVGPALPGDSGGPIVHEDGTGFGSITHISFSGTPQRNGVGGPLLEHVIADAARDGFTVTLRTAS